MNTVLISFYSDIEDRTYYSDNADRIIKECESLSIPYHIKEKESLGSYQLNCLSKPQFILDTMEELNRPVLWMDIDSKLHKPLDIFDTFDEDTDMGVTSSNANITGVRASPMYFGNTPKAKEFIHAWISTTRDIIENNKGIFDHEPLFTLIPMFIKQMKVAMVGGEYCTWPGYTNENTCITMGLADSEGKIESLRSLGIDEGLIQWQSPGNVE